MYSFPHKDSIPQEGNEMHTNAYYTADALFKLSERAPDWIERMEYPDKGAPPCDHAWVEITTFDDHAQGWHRFLCEQCDLRFMQKEPPCTPPLLPL